MIMVMLWINYSLDPWALLKVKNISSNGKHRPYVSPITSGSFLFVNDNGYVMD